LNPELWYQHAVANRVQSLLLLTVMGGFLALLGWLLWGAGGLAMLVAMGALLASFTPKLTPHLIMRMYGARPLPPAHAPTLYAALGELAGRAGLGFAPALYYVPSRMVNAFGVGHPDQAGIAVTDGLLRTLDVREAIGVLAHEVSHIRSDDMWVMGLADMFSRLTSMLSVFGQLLLLLNLPLILFSSVRIDWFAILILIFAPSVSALAQLGLSRTREYDADLNAARLTGDPEGLARALVKIERVQGAWLMHLFFPGRRIPEPSLLRTHPPTTERVQRLMALKPPADSRPVVVRPDMASLAHALFTDPVQRPPRWHLNGLWH